MAVQGTQHPIPSPDREDYMERHLALHLVRTADDEVFEQVDIVADPDELRGFHALLRRHFLHMAARAAQEDLPRDLDPERMEWLHDWTLTVSDGQRHSDILMRFREG